MALDPPPDKAPIADRWFTSGDWLRWFLAIWGNVSAQPLLIGLTTSTPGSPATSPPVSLTNQNAAIATTPIPLPTLTGEPCRITWYARITTADGVSSSLTVTISWTEGGVAKSVSGAALTGDSIGTLQSGTVMIPADQGTPINYATAYASNTPNKMKYRLIVMVEQL
jgi:hypothetical protein